MLGIHALDKEVFSNAYFCGEIKRERKVLIRINQKGSSKKSKHRKGLIIGKRYGIEFTRLSITSPTR